MTKNVLGPRTVERFTGEGVGDDFSCAEFPRKVPRINAENDGPHVLTPRAITSVKDAVTYGYLAGLRIPAAAKGEPRKLRVSVWCGFAHVIAEVTVNPGTAMPVTIEAAWVEDAVSRLSATDLDRIGVKRSTGFIPLREAIETRAREEAFA